MARELRKVPANWEHPKNSEGEYIPLCDNYKLSCDSWDKENEMWSAGYIRTYVPTEKGAEINWIAKPDEAEYNCSFIEWYGERPVKSEYMPEWVEEEKTHFQMYEDCTEGTPISPVMDTPENLAHWLADNNASSFGNSVATYEQWLSMIVGSGYSFGFGVFENKVINGIEIEHMKKDEKMSRENNAKSNSKIYIFMIALIAVLGGMVYLTPSEPSREEIRNEITKAIKNCGNYSIQKHTSITSNSMPQTSVELTCENGSTVSIREYIFNQVQDKKLGY